MYLEAFGLWVPLIKIHHTVESYKLHGQWDKQAAVLYLDNPVKDLKHNFSLFVQKKLFRTILQAHIVVNNWNDIT